MLPLLHTDDLAEAVSASQSLRRHGETTPITFFLVSSSPWLFMVLGELESLIDCRGQRQAGYRGIESVKPSNTWTGTLHCPVVFCVSQFLTNASCSSLSSVLLLGRALLILASGNPVVYCEYSITLGCTFLISYPEIPSNSHVGSRSVCSRSEVPITAPDNKDFNINPAPLRSIHSLSLIGCFASYVPFCSWILRLFHCCWMLLSSIEELRKHLRPYRKESTVQ